MKNGTLNVLAAFLICICFSQTLPYLEINWTHLKARDSCLPPMFRPNVVYAMQMKVPAAVGQWLSLSEVAVRRELLGLFEMLYLQGDKTEKF